MELSAPKVIKRPKPIENIEEVKATKVASIKDVKPVKLRSNDKRKRYLNPKTGNMVLWKSPLASKCKEMSALSAIK